MLFQINLNLKNDRNRWQTIQRFRKNRYQLKQDEQIVSIFSSSLLSPFITCNFITVNSEVAE